MSDNEPKKASPAYVAHKTFDNFINGLRENGIPSRIDRSAMSGMSGSGQSALKASLEYLGLINADEEPTDKLHQLVDAEEENRPAVLAEILREAYPYLIGGSIDLKRATTKQIEEAFRAQNISGSTVVKAIAFFLTAAKSAGIEISSYIKTPTLVRINPPKRSNGTEGKPVTSADDDGEPADVIPQGMRQIKLPLIGKQDVILALPEKFDSSDWKFLKPILEAYIQRMLDEEMLK
ncbi:MAG: DUF5343 domain-containing protein [Steroidobacteraceae bacterium]|jgi:hypothetical protein